MRFFQLLCFVAVLLLAKPGHSQSILDLRWSDNGSEFLYRSNGKRFRVDVETGQKTIVDDNADESPRLVLPPLRSIDGGQETRMKLVNESGQSLEVFWVDARGTERSYGEIEDGSSFDQHTYIGHAWLFKSGGKRIGSFRARESEDLKIDEQLLKNVQQSKRKPARKKQPKRNRPSRNKRSPDKKWKVSVRDHNLWLNEQQLTDDAKQEHTFENVGSGTYWFDRPRGADVRWSPDSKYVVAFQTRNPKSPKVYFVESAPPNQLQPKLNNYQYPKPGDWLPQKSLRLFSATDAKEISLSDELFENPWSLRFVKWTEDGKKFWLHYNQRGHQVVRLIEVEAATGKARTLIEEKSDTFIHYSNGAKSLFEQLEDQTILWASERSGWNHIYRFDSGGKQVNAVTRGDWNVKRIEWIDEENEIVWFHAVGVHEDQDPYHEHFCRVNFDGSQFKILTEGDGTHQIQFERDGKYLLDKWSRVDLAPVTELRDAETGEFIVELERGNAKAAFADRRLTTRFSAKGRDGETDIWGIIHWPRDFDPKAKYPVVEQIYAGPHDHHVPKKFRSHYFFPHQFADAGFIVVQIDGMGTAWRSKKFHDVCHKNLKDGGFPDRIAWMKAAAKQYPQMDLDRVGIFGGSAGGQNAMAALLWHNEFYKVAVADCGCHDNRMDKIWWNEQWMGWPVDKSYAENSNMENAHLLQGQLMLTVGEMDRNVDPATTTQVVKKLIEADKDFEFVLVPGKGHGAGDSPWAAKKRLNFFKKHLQP